MLRGFSKGKLIELCGYRSLRNGWAGDLEINLLLLLCS